MVPAHPRPAVTAFLTVLALFAFAANSIFGRLALGGHSIDPASYTFVRLATGATSLWIIARWRQVDSSGISASTWTAGVMLSLYAVTFSFAYISLSTGTGALILFASVQITMLGIGLYRGERPQPAQWLGLLIAILGLIYLVSPGITAPSPLGSLLMGTAGAAWGIYSLLGGGAKDPVITTSGNFLRTVPMALVILLPWLSSPTITPKGFLWATLSGSITSAIGYVIWYAALRGLTTTLAATVQLSVPVIAALGGVVFMSEQITSRLIASGATILAGVGLAIWSHRGK